MRVSCGTRDGFGLVRDHRPAVWSYGAVCDRRLGFQHSRTVGERERFTCQVEGQGQGLFAVSGVGPDHPATLTTRNNLAYWLHKSGRVTRA